MDYNTKLNGEDVVLRDVTDPAYVPPATGYVIHLNTPAARKFVRAELDENRVAKLIAQDRRDQGLEIRDTGISRRDSGIAMKDAAVVDIDNAQLRIDEQRAFLQANGDDPDA